MAVGDACIVLCPCLDDAGHLSRVSGLYIVMFGTPTTKDEMSRKRSREDRIEVDAARVRTALTALYGERPGLRRIAPKIGVQKSTLSRLWGAKGAMSISRKHHGNLCWHLGVHPDWISPKAPDPHDGWEEWPPLLSGYGFGAIFPGMDLKEAHEHKEFEVTMPGLKGVFWIERMVAAAMKLRAPGSRDHPQQWRVRISESITEALEVVAKQWGRELGRLPLKRRKAVLDAWCEVWAKTLEAAIDAPPTEPSEAPRTGIAAGMPRVVRRVLPAGGGTGGTARSRSKP